MNSLRHSGGFPRVSTAGHGGRAPLTFSKVNKLGNQHFRLHCRAIAAAAFLVLASGVHAQTSGAVVRGAVAGVTASSPVEVLATNTATGVTQRARSDAQGRYMLAGLSPGHYKITVLSGTTVKLERQVELQIGQTLALDMSLDVTTLDTVQVSGRAQREKTTSEIGTVVSLEQMKRLPQVSRNFLSFADLAPGVNVTYDANNNISMRGRRVHPVVEQYLHRRRGPEGLYVPRRRSRSG